MSIHTQTHIHTHRYMYKHSGTFWSSYGVEILNFTVCLFIYIVYMLILCILWYFDISETFLPEWEWPDLCLGILRNQGTSKRGCASDLCANHLETDSVPRAPRRQLSCALRTWNRAQVTGDHLLIQSPLKSFRAAPASVLCLHFLSWSNASPGSCHFAPLPPFLCLSFSFLLCSPHPFYCLSLLLYFLSLIFPALPFLSFCMKPPFLTFIPTSLSWLLLALKI